MKRITAIVILLIIVMITGDFILQLAIIQPVIIETSKIVFKDKIITKEIKAKQDCPIIQPTYVAIKNGVDFKKGDLFIFAGTDYFDDTSGLQIPLFCKLVESDNSNVCFNLKAIKSSGFFIKE